MTDGGLAPSISIPGFRIDAQQRRLIAADTGQAVPLGGRAFEALLHLASRPGLLIGKSELMEAVWPDVTVEENTLTQCISGLRRALGERPGQHRFIATEPGRGYRFIADTSGSRPRGVVSTANAPAFQAYVTGWSVLTRPGAGNLRRGLDELEKATRLDPDFALAHVCVADGYALLGVFGVEAPAEVFPSAKAAVARALELAPDFAEAHAELGHIRAVYDLDFAGAEAAYAKALALDPGCVLALHYLGLLRTAEGRFDDAIHNLRAAQEQEPLAANLSANIGQAHYYAWRYDEARRQLERALDLEGGFVHAMSLLGRCHLRQGDFQRALEIFRARPGRTIGSDADIPAALALSGATNAARESLATLKAEAGRRYVSPYDLATVHAALGDEQQALDHLQAALEGSAQPINFFRSDPSFERLRGHPRFAEMAARLGARPVSVG